MFLNYSNIKPPFGSKINKNHPLTIGMEEAFLLNYIGGRNDASTYENYNSPFTHLLYKQEHITYDLGKFTANHNHPSTNNKLYRMNNTPILDGYGACTILIRVLTFNIDAHNEQYFFGIGNLYNPSIRLFIKKTTHALKAVFSTVDSGGTFEVGTNLVPIVNDKFFDVALVYNGSAVKMYINNILTETILTTGVLRPSFGLIELGKTPQITSVGLWGKLDYCYIYHRALSMGEVRSLHLNPYQIVEPFYLSPPKAKNIIPDTLIISAGIKFNSCVELVKSESVITDHTKRSLNLLVEQFEDKINLNNLVSSFVSPIQEIEYVCNDFLTLRNINNAIGKQLDIVGAIAGENRNFRNDDDYREAIKIRVILNKSFGEPEIIITALKSIVDITKMSYFENYPASIDIYFKAEIIDNIPSNLIEQIELICLAGVGVTINYSINDGDDFGFDSEGGFSHDPDVLGFGEINLSDEGGRFVERLTN